jgi:hypothetical protein
MENTSAKSSLVHKVSRSRYVRAVLGKKKERTSISKSETKRKSPSSMVEQLMIGQAIAVCGLHRLLLDGSMPTFNLLCNILK